MVSATWKLRDKNLKKYPHFDSGLTCAEAESLANDPERVARHTFYPFMLFHNRWNRFAPKGKKGASKDRPIRYACRADAYIFARYRQLLSDLYETKLASSGLSNAILAYRRIMDTEGQGGKCNIHFARDAFAEIVRQGSCCTIALDISSFFESLDHERLKSEWCSLLGLPRLPIDHFKVFQAITNYAFVDKQEVYERLEHFGPKPATSGNKPIKGYLTPKRRMPLQLCRGKEFREKIAGGDGRPSIIHKHKDDFGIPQGAPISDLLANLYLLSFDIEMRDIMRKCGGAYFRYSDDILLIAPVCASEAIALESHARKSIESYGAHLKIKSSKSSILRFWPEGDHQSFEVVFDGQSSAEREKSKREELRAGGKNLHSPQSKKEIKEAIEVGRKALNGLEYLGFRFDGRNVYLRDSTLSNLWRKISAGIWRECKKFIEKNPTLDLAETRTKFKTRHEIVVKAYGRVEGFKERSDEHRHWTFWTYAQRSAKAFGPLGLPILKQLKGHRSKILSRAETALERAFYKK